MSDKASVREPSAPAARPVRHLSQTALSDRWGISPRTLERWRWLGQGPAFLKIGGRVVYRLADVLAFEEQQVRRAESAPPPVPRFTDHPRAR